MTHIAGAFWSSLFVHRGAVYLLGASQQYGSIVIRRSEDGGNTWTHPADESSGLLFRGGPYREGPNYHCAPVPVLEAGGRLYRAFEDCDPCQWPAGFQALVISADAGADLLRAASWRMSNKLPYDPAWNPPAWGPLQAPGWLEGNMVAGARRRAVGHPALQLHPAGEQGRDGARPSMRAGASPLTRRTALSTCPAA